jgi:hypothetical protein
MFFFKKDLERIYGRKRRSGQLFAPMSFVRGCGPLSREVSRHGRALCGTAQVSRTTASSAMRLVETQRWLDRFILIPATPGVLPSRNRDLL